MNTLFSSLIYSSVSTFESSHSRLLTRWSVDIVIELSVWTGWNSPNTTWCSSRYSYLVMERSDGSSHIWIQLFVALQHVIVRQCMPAVSLRGRKHSTNWWVWFHWFLEDNEGSSVRGAISTFVSTHETSTCPPWSNQSAHWYPWSMID